MAVLLNLETATKTCSVALGKEGSVVACKSVTSEQYAHSERLNGMIQDVLAEGGYSLSDVEGVAVSAGPGSYTGLRIGTSTAKGLCYALDIPLIAVSSLKALAHCVDGASSLICPLFDARRMEVYAALYDARLNELLPTAAVVVDDHFLHDFRERYVIRLLGPGMAKCKQILRHPNFQFDDTTAVSARGMVALSDAKFTASDIEDTAYFEPTYLKDFVAGKPKPLL